MKILRTALAGALGMLLSLSSHALTAGQAYAMAASEDNDARAAAINAAVLAPSEGRIVFPNVKSQPGTEWFYLARPSDRQLG